MRWLKPPNAGKISAAFGGKMSLPIFRKLSTSSRVSDRICQKESDNSFAHF
jgi:hypothetical protein